MEITQAPLPIRVDLTGYPRAGTRDDYDRAQKLGSEAEYLETLRGFENHLLQFTKGARWCLDEHNRFVALIGRTLIFQRFQNGLIVLAADVEKPKWREIGDQEAEDLIQKARKLSAARRS